ncbi:unnamed protein product [Ambrosiozyma monospora]|uniref:Unnamed protein product n=1 Tax=Ambrosiozyma monospora TaxID=43982 RepID=A0ACB5ST53_AMBMO|nr:unnamed protein product [Ambrosiozyma monospora]
MGRRKIAIEPIDDERNRTVTFVKRKAGLFKKAHELAILCKVDVAVLIIGHNHKLYDYTSNDPNEIIHLYQTSGTPYESKKPSDYGKGYKYESRIAKLSKNANSKPRSRGHSRASSRNTNTLTTTKFKVEEEDEDDSSLDSDDGDEDSSLNF